MADQAYIISKTFEPKQKGSRSKKIFNQHFAVLSPTKNHCDSINLFVKKLGLSQPINESKDPTFRRKKVFFQLQSKFKFKFPASTDFFRSEMCSNRKCVSSHVNKKMCFVATVTT